MNKRTGGAACGVRVEANALAAALTQAFRVCKVARPERLRRAWVGPAVEGEGLVVRATDLEVGLQVEVPGEGRALAGPVLLPPKALDLFKHTMRGEVVTVECEGGRARVRVRGTNALLPEADPLEFPEWPGPRSWGSAGVIDDVAGFARALTTAWVYAASDPARGAQYGVRLEAQHGGLCAVGTDGKRLYVSPSLPFLGALCGTLTPSAIGALLPLLRATNQKNGDGDESGVEVLLSEGKGEPAFRVGRAMVHAAWMGGKFPEWEDVVPKGKPTWAVSIGTDALQRALKEIAPFVDFSRPPSKYPHDPSPILTLEATAEGQLMLRAKNDDLGEGEVLTDGVVEWKGEPRGIRLQHPFLVDLADHATSPTVGLEQVVDKGPVRVQDAGGLHLLMPMAPV